MKYKYLTLTRINSTIKKHGLRLEYKKGSKDFRFFSLNTNTQVGETFVLDKLHSLTISEWRTKASEYSGNTTATSKEEAEAFVEELVGSC
jgi:hypothetical protein